MSFLKKLFGGGGDKPAAPAATQEHRDFTIHAAPIAEGGQFRVAGRITRTVDGTTREHAFQRADRMASRDEAIETTFRKGRQIIDEQGERIFG